MTGLKLYQQLMAAANENQKLQILAQAIEEAKNPDFSQLVTKSDLKAEIGALKAEIYKAIADQSKLISEQTWKFVGGVALIGVIFKVGDALLRHF